MNMSKNDRCPDALLRVRRQNSISNPASQVTHNGAAQRRASLLKNNKNLAVSLQETRCELSAYKGFFDESLDFLNKAKLAKTRIAQLSSAFKNFVKALDENLALLDFDESKWLNFKVSPQRGKIFQKEIIPISEMAGEVPEEVILDQEMNCESGSSSHPSDQVFIKEKSDSPKTLSRSPQKKTEDFVKNKNLGSSPQTGDAEGRENARTEAPTTSRTDVPKISDSLQNPLPAVSVSTQAVKVTKIPRCQALSVTLNRQDFVKGSAQPLNKAYKRKLPQKVSEESEPNASRRKTYVVKDRNVLTVTSYTKILPDENESRPLSESPSNRSQDRLISKNDKRQTFVIKARNASEETEPATNSNNAINSELLTESRVNGDKTSPVREIILGNKRKTFVKKPPFRESDIVCQVQYPNGLCATTFTDNYENNKVRENSKSSPNLQLNREQHSENDPAAVKSKSISVENSKNMEHAANFTSPKPNIRLGSSSKEMLSLSNATEGIPENPKSNFIPARTATKVADVVTKRFTFTSYSEVDEDIDKVGETSPKKIRESFFESSGSDCEVMMIEQLVDFSAMKPALKTTPIRRQITTKNKKRKFAFDGKRGKTVLEKEPQCEIVNSETVENGSQESVEVCQSDTGAITDNEVNKINEAGATRIISEEIVDRDDLISEEIVNRDDLISKEIVNRDDLISEEIVNRDNLISEEIVNRDNYIPLDACAVKKKTTKGPRKMKDNQGTSTKSNKGKRASKAQNGKKKKNPSAAAIEVDALNRICKKVKKRNVKKNERSCFDDNAISKFEEVNKTTKVNKVKVAEKEPESDFSCEKIGVNTFLVQAEIHPPPPSSLNMPDIGDLNKENEKLNLQHMQVAVVLDDILKSKNIELLNINDKNLLCGKSVTFKSPLSASTSNFAIDPEESIEKFRCDLAPSEVDCDLDAAELIDISHDDLQCDPVSEDIEIVEIPRRRGRKVNYKEKPLNRKIRRS